MTEVEAKIAREFTAEQLRRDLLRNELDRYLVGGGLDIDENNPSSVYYKALSLRLMFWVNAWGVLGTGTVKTEAERPEEIAKESMNVIFGFIPVAGSKLAAANEALWGAYNSANNRRIWTKIGEFFKALREQAGWETNDKIITYLVQQMTLARKPQDLMGATSFTGRLRDKLGYGVTNKAQEEALLDLMNFMKVLWTLSDLTPFIKGNKSINKNGLDLLLEAVFTDKRLLFPRPLPEIVQHHYQQALSIHAERLRGAEHKDSEMHTLLTDMKKEMRKEMQRELEAMKVSMREEMQRELEAIKASMRAEFATMKAAAAAPADAVSTVAAAGAAAPYRMFASV